MSNFSYSRRVVDGNFVGFWHTAEFEPFAVVVSSSGELETGDHEVTGDLHEYACGVAFALGAKLRTSVAEVKVGWDRRQWMAVVAIAGEELAIAATRPESGWYYLSSLGAGRWARLERDLCEFEGGLLAALTARLEGDPELQKQVRVKISAARRQQSAHDSGRRQHR